MITIDPQIVMQHRIAGALGLDKYSVIMDIAHASDVSENDAFQHTYNGFYGVRRNEAWRKQYYSLFEEAKKNNYDFERILAELYSRTGNVEASFSSKMVATIDPNKPIWDKYVVENLGLKVPGTYDSDRLEKTVALYHKIEAWYEEYLQTPEAENCIRYWDEMLPDFTWLTDVKKIDYYLWSIR